MRAARGPGQVADPHPGPSDDGARELIDLIDGYNEDASIDGILVQLPLPKHIEPESIIERIDVRKDVDGFHPYNVGRLAIRLPNIRPCTPYGITKIIDQTGMAPKGRHCVVVGASNNVGRPMALARLGA